MEWLANLCSHIPNRGEQMVRYYGYYSNVSRGKRQKESSDETIPFLFVVFVMMSLEGFAIHYLL